MVDWEGLASIGPVNGAIVIAAFVVAALVVTARRKSTRRTIVDMKDFGQRLLDDIVAAKPIDDDVPYWARHNDWDRAVSKTLASVDPKLLPWWNAPIENHEIEAATRERVERLSRMARR
jgi:hypothetical protein